VHSRLSIPLKRSSLPHAPLVIVCGNEASARVEENSHEEKIDHVWISIHCGLPAPVTVAVNTLSIRNRALGFDSRLRIGKVAGFAKHLPRAGYGILERFDYADIESINNVFYETYERAGVEDLLLELTLESMVIEAWGEPYRRQGKPGIHQVHSRRASCAVNEDLHGRDGGLKFYSREDGGFRWTLVLLKFCGQA